MIIRFCISQNIYRPTSLYQPRVIYRGINTTTTRYLNVDTWSLKFKLAMVHKIIVLVLYLCTTPAVMYHHGWGTMSPVTRTELLIDGLSRPDILLTRAALSTTTTRKNN